MTVDEQRVVELEAFANWLLNSPVLAYRNLGRSTLVAVRADRAVLD